MRGTGLPAASPKTTYRVLFEALNAAPERVFTQNALREIGIKQASQGRSLLQFLHLLTRSGGLADDFLRERGNPADLAKLLRDRLQDGCVRAGCEPSSVTALGTRQMAEDELESVLRSLKPIKSQPNPNVVSNQVNCLRAICQFVGRDCETRFLERELMRFNLREGETPVATRSVFVAIRTEPVIVGFRQNCPLYAQVSWPADLDGNQLEMLARQLFTLAMKEQGRKDPSTLRMGELMSSGVDPLFRGTQPGLGARHVGTPSGAERDHADMVETPSESMNAAADQPSGRFIN